jgi:hypothetical protein
MRMGFLIRDTAHHGMGLFRARFLIERAWASKGLAGVSAHPKPQIVVPAKSGDP